MPRTKSGLQKVLILKKTAVLCPSYSYYSEHNILCRYSTFQHCNGKPLELCKCH